MKNLQKIKKEKKFRRQKRTRAKIYGTSARPRLTVFRSLKHCFLQLIDDSKGKTLISASDGEIKKEDMDLKERTAKAAQAYETGKLLAKKAREKGIKEIIFDRAGYKYHGRVKAAAEGAREGGLIF